ncbi:MAG: DUF262 domain-containing protein [Deltaproteobacteria bacterium]|jgi:hypothetical protein|nr:DUF262 domain-containing protein [Deltaproteobacteria bacterium]
MSLKKTLINETNHPKEQDHLHPFEKISFSDPDTKTKATDEELNTRYVSGKFRIVTEQARYPLSTILSMLNEEIVGDDGKKEPRYILDPEYQRRHRWDDKRKSRLIESFLMNAPVPPVFLFERDLARFEVIDGRQRLTALSEFYDDKFALTGLEFWSDLDGKKYSELPSKIRGGINRRYISSVILLKETSTGDNDVAKLKKIVFERLNFGGVELSDQEARNAVYNGPLNSLCVDLSENEHFRLMWGIPNNHNLKVKDSDEEIDESTKSGNSMFEKMDDVELVLRFFAYRNIANFKPGLNRISEFLDRFIIEGNKFTVEDLKVYRDMFEKTIDFLWKILDKKAFTLLGSTKTRPTKIIYDPIMFTASGFDVVEQYDNLIKNKDKLRDNLKKMYRENKELFSGRSSNLNHTQQRNELTLKAFTNAIANTNK